MGAPMVLGWGNSGVRVCPDVRPGGKRVSAWRGYRGVMGRVLEGGRTEVWELSLGMSGWALGMSLGEEG